MQGRPVSQHLATLKKLAREAEVEVLEYPDGRVLVIGGLVNVHWWPGSSA